MINTDATSTAVPALLTGRGISPAAAVKASDLLPLCDFAGLLAAGYFSLAAFAASAIARPEVWTEFYWLTWIAAGLAPFMLYDQRFGASAGEGRGAALALGFVRRFLLLLSVVCAIAYAGRWLDHAPRAWLALWLGCALLLTSASRVLFAGYLRRLSRRGTVTLEQVITERHPQNVGYVGDWLPVTLLADRPIQRWGAVVKEVKDLILASIITLLLLPVFAGIVLAIRLDSPGPILFKQRRHGINNREFDIYKFRTMRYAVEDASAALQQTVRGDSRVTRVGRFLRKWSLDELPQIFNVLEGTMSLVGPRPHAVNMRTEDQFGHEITHVYPHRHRVKPGITGWAQINGSRGATDTAEKLRRRIELDLYYVDHWSLPLDLKILILTTREVLRANNAF